MKLFFRKHNKLNKAFTLVETLVAIAIFSVSILGLMSVLASSISSTNYAKQKAIATYLAQEGIECVRNMRDNYILNNNWTGFVTLDVSTISCPSIDIGSGFTREISEDNAGLGSNEVKIISKVSWTQGSGIKNVILSENLFNWY